MFSGCYTALITPMTPKGVDYDGLARLVEFQVVSGISGILAVGTTGDNYPIVDGTGGDLTLTEDAGTFINGQNGSNYRDTNLGYGEIDGMDIRTYFSNTEDLL